MEGANPQKQSYDLNNKEMTLITDSKNNSKLTNY